MQVIRNLRKDEQLVDDCVVPKDPESTFDLYAHVRDGSLATRFTSWSLFQPHIIAAGDPKSYGRITGMRPQVIQQLYDKAGDCLRLFKGDADETGADFKALYTLELANANGVKGIAAGWSVHSREVCLDNHPLPGVLLVDSCEWDSMTLTKQEDLALREMIAKHFGWDYADDMYGKYFFSAQSMATWLCIAIDESNAVAATACAKRLRELF